MINNDIKIVYGPLTTNYFKCKKCSHKWSAVLASGTVPKVTYCPNCGTKNIKKI